MKIFNAIFLILLVGCSNSNKNNQNELLENENKYISETMVFKLGGNEYQIKHPLDFEIVPVGKAELLFYFQQLCDTNSYKCPMLVVSDDKTDMSLTDYLSMNIENLEKGTLAENIKYESYKHRGTDAYNIMYEFYAGDVKCISYSRQIRYHDYIFTLNAIVEKNNKSLKMMKVLMKMIDSFHTKA